MCTALIYSDADGRSYLGRTLELTIDLPYQVVFLPPGFAASSQIAGHPALAYTSRHGFLSLTMPWRVRRRMPLSASVISRWSKGSMIRASPSACCPIPPRPASRRRWR